MYIRSNSSYRVKKSSNYFTRFWLYVLILVVSISFISSFLGFYQTGRKSWGFFLVNNSLMNFHIHRGDLVIVDKENTTNFLEKYRNNFLSIINIIKIFKKKELSLKIYRVIAVEGDFVEFKNHGFYINGEELEGIKHDDFYTMEPVKVDKHQFFCLSLNADDIFDSSILGIYTFENILGKVFFTGR